jgi:hypothetical protein
MGLEVYQLSTGFGRSPYGAARYLVVYKIVHKKIRVPGTIEWCHVRS